MLLLRRPKLLHHSLDLGRDRLMRHVGRRWLVDQARVHLRLIALRERTDCRDQITVPQPAIAAGALRQRKAQPQNQLLALVEKLFHDLDLWEHGLAIGWTRRLLVPHGVFPRLLQIRTIARAVERYFALLPATLRADSAVNSRAKPLFFSFFADGTTQMQAPRFDYFTEDPSPLQ
jgi:hypothetical protein